MYKLVKYELGVEDAFELPPSDYYATTTFIFDHEDVTDKAIPIIINENGVVRVKKGDLILVSDETKLLVTKEQLETLYVQV